MIIKKVFKQQIAKELQQLGNFCIATEPNLKRVGYQVYLFEVNEKFKQDLDIIFKSNKMLLPE